MIEQRRYKRSPFQLTARVLLVGESRQEEREPVRSRCRDISNGGLSFYASSRFARGDVVRLTILLPETRVYKEKKKDVDSITVLAKVMYSSYMAEKKRYLTGVQFLNIYQADYDFLCSYIVDTMADSRGFL